MPNQNVNLRVESLSVSTSLPNGVQRVLSRAEKANIEQGESWLKNLASTVFPGDQGVRIYALYDQENLLALLPVRVTGNDQGRQIEALGNFYTSLYQPYLAETASAQQVAFLIRKMVDENQPMSSLALSPMAVDAHEFKVLCAGIRAAGLAAFRFFRFGNWYLTVAEPWIEYFASRPSQVRNTIKRKSKAFRTDGGVIELITGGDRIEYGIGAYQAIYLASWKVPEPYPDFMPGLIRMLASNGWLRLGVASLNGQPVAAQVWIVAYGKASIFKLAHNEDYKRYSAGSLLTAMLMQHVMEVDGVREVDYLIGDDPYKALWMNRRRERWGIIGYNRKTLKGLLGWGEESFRRLLKPVASRLLRRSAE
jgi:hypothetical protein